MSPSMLEYREERFTNTLFDIEMNTSFQHPHETPVQVLAPLRVC